MWIQCLKCLSGSKTGQAGLNFLSYTTSEIKKWKPKIPPKTFPIFQTSTFFFICQLFSNLHRKIREWRREAIWWLVLCRRVLNLEQVRDSLLKGNVASCELRLDSTRIFSTVSIGSCSTHLSWCHWLHLRYNALMNCYHFEVHLLDFEDLVYENQNLTNLVVSNQVKYLHSCHILGFAGSRYGLKRTTLY